jgi:hypothetical protein
MLIVLIVVQFLCLKNNEVTGRSSMDRRPSNTSGCYDHLVHINVGSEFNDTRLGMVDKGQRGWREIQQ